MSQHNENGTVAGLSPFARAAAAIVQMSRTEVFINDYEGDPHGENLGVGGTSFAEQETTGETK